MMYNIDIKKISKLTTTLVKFTSLFLVSLGMLTSTAQARPLAWLGFEEAQGTRFVKSNSTCCRYLYDNWNDKTFNIARQAASNLPLQHSWVSKSIANEGSQSLGVWLKQNTVVQESQRVEFKIANSVNFRPVLDETIYYSFALYIHPSSPNEIERNTIFTQVWQVHETTPSKHPAFSVAFDEDSDYEWTVSTASDVPGVDDRTTKGTKVPIYSSPNGLAKGVWHEFIVMFRPSVQNKGAVRVWHNGQLAVSQTSNRNFGYKPQTAEPFMTNRLEYRFGAYRTTGPTFPGDIILMYDQAKIGKSYSEVDP